MANDAQPIDPDKLKAEGQKVFGHLKGALVSAMIHLGDKLGLYRALQSHDLTVTYPGPDQIGTITCITQHINVGTTV